MKYPDFRFSTYLPLRYLSKDRRKFVFFFNSYFPFGFLKTYIYDIKIPTKEVEEKQSKIIGTPDIFNKESDQYIKNSIIHLFSIFIIFQPIYHTDDERTADSFNQFIKASIEKEGNSAENQEKERKEKKKNGEKQLKNKEKKAVRSKDEL